MVLLLHVCGVIYCSTAKQDWQIHLLTAYIKKESTHIKYIIRERLGNQSRTVRLFCLVLAK